MSFVSFCPCILLAFSSTSLLASFSLYCFAVISALFLSSFGLSPQAILFISISSSSGTFCLCILILVFHFVPSLRAKRLLVFTLYLSHISVFALAFCALLCWNLPSLSNYANLCRYHLRHYMCHLIEVPYLLPFCTIHYCIGCLHYIYSHHICPLSYLVLLKLQLIQQWRAIVLPGACLDLGLIYGTLNLVFYHALYHNLLHCQYIVYSDLSLWGITLHGALYMSPGFIIIINLLIFHQFMHFIIFSHKIVINITCFYGPFHFSQYAIISFV